MCKPIRRYSSVLGAVGLCHQKLLCNVAENVIQFGEIRHYTASVRMEHRAIERVISCEGVCIS